MVYRKYNVKPRYNDKFSSKPKEDKNLLGKLVNIYGEPIIKESDYICHNQEGIWEIDGILVLGKCTHSGACQVIYILGNENRLDETKKDLENKLNIDLEESK